jgi:hypothetical protein
METDAMIQHSPRISRRGVLASEWVFITTILVLGAITGLVAVRKQHLPQLREMVKTQPATPAK